MESEGAVKPLVWEPLGDDFAKAKTPLNISIRVEKYSRAFTVAWSVPGFCDTFTEGEFDTLDAAKSAAQADYERRVLSALPDGARVVTAERLNEVWDFPDYDAGLLNDYGGGNVDWWQDYLRAEIDRANEHWRELVNAAMRRIAGDE